LWRLAKEGYLKYAGADQVISPKHYSGLISDEKPSILLQTILPGATRFFEDLNIVEFQISRRSLISTKLKIQNIRKETGANLVVYGQGSCH